MTVEASIQGSEEQRGLPLLSRTFIDFNLLPRPSDCVWMFLLIPWQIRMKKSRRYMGAPIEAKEDSMEAPKVLPVENSVETPRAESSEKLRPLPRASIHYHVLQLASTCVTFLPRTLMYLCFLPLASMHFPALPRRYMLFLTLPHEKGNIVKILRKKIQGSDEVNRNGGSGKFRRGPASLQ